MTTMTTMLLILLLMLMIMMMIIVVVVVVVVGRWELMLVLMVHQVIFSWDAVVAATPVAVYTVAATATHLGFADNATAADDDDDND